MTRRKPVTDTVADRATAATVSRNIDLLWPVGVWAALWPLGLGCWLLWGHSAGLPWVTILQTLVFVTLTWLVGFIAHTRHHRKPLDVGHSVVTMILASTFIVSATIAAPWAHPLVDLWAFLGLATAASWTLRAVMERRDKQAHQSGQPSRRGAAMAFLKSHGLDVEAKVIEATPERIDVAIDTTDSEDQLLPADVAEHSKHLAASLGVPSNGVTVIEDPDHAGKGLMRIVKRDLLRTPIPWPGPSAPGGTPFDPIVQGVYQDGLIAAKTVADESGTRHQLTVGMSGSGKSNGARVDMSEMVTRAEVFPIVVDTVKRTQVFGPLAPALGMFIIDVPTARKFVKRLRRVIAGRTSYLGARGLDAWMPGCGLSFLPIQLEEYSELDVSEAEVQSTAKAARSAGIRLVLSLQRAQHTQMDTTTRAQLGQSQTYGCSDDFGDDAIPEEVLNSGADPRRWRDEMPGCNYLIAKGIPARQKATPLRDYEMTVSQLRVHAAEWGPRMMSLDPVTAKLFGDLWTSMLSPVEVVRQANDAALGVTTSAPVASQVSRPTRVEEEPVDDDEELDFDEDDDMPTDEELGVITEDLLPDVDVDANVELPRLGSGQDIAFGPALQVARGPMTEADTEEARRVVADRIAELEREGLEEIRPTDFAEWYTSEPKLRSRAWFRKELQRLVEVGRLQFDDEDKTYRILPDPNMIAV
jgi:hypothetical protein